MAGITDCITKQNMQIYSGRFPLGHNCWATRYVQSHLSLELVCTVGVSPSLVSRYCEDYSFFYSLPGVYRRSIFKIRPNILIGLQKLRLRPKDQSQLFIHLIFLRQFCGKQKWHCGIDQILSYSAKVFT